MLRPCSTATSRSSSMRISRVSLARLSLLVSLCLQLCAVALPVTAQAAASVNVLNSQALPDFPNSISFELTAEVEGDVDYVDLVYVEASLETFQLLPTELEVDGSQLTALATADLEIYVLPPGIDLTYHWLVT